MLSITLFVDGDAAAGGNGLGWGTAYDDLQDALSQATVLNSDSSMSNDVEAIWVAEGMYEPSAELQAGDVRSASFSLLDGVTLYGGFVGTETMLAQRNLSIHTTTLSGDLGVIGDGSDNAYTVVYCGSGVESAIDGFSLVDGKGETTIHAGNPEKSGGGGIFNAGTLAVDNTMILSGSGYIGGGIYNYDSGTLTLTDSVITENSTEHGGGIDNKGEMTILRSLISNNESSVGGGIYNYAGTLAIINSTITGNSSSFGGGICNYHDTALSVTNSTIANNSAAGGGGIGNWGELSVTNSTIAYNTSSYDGGGIRNDASAAVTILNNSIVANNTAYNDGPDVFSMVGTLSGSYNLIGDGSYQSTLFHGIDGNLVGTSTTPIDSKLGSLLQFSNGQLGYPILPDSPAMDAGNNALALDALGLPLTEDIAGNARIINHTVDMGAVEDTATSSLYIVTSLADTIANDGILTFAEAFQAANSNMAVGDAVAGSSVKRDVIQFTNGLSGTVSLSSQLIVDDDLSIKGPGEGQLTFDAGSTTRAFFIQSGISVTLSGMTIANGYTDYGAAVYCGSGSTLTIEDSTLSNNVASEDGGAIYNYSATVMVIDSTLSSNSAYNNNGEGGGGGGIYNYGMLTVAKSTFSNNSTNSDGGAILTSNGTVAVTNSTLSDNSAVNFGGGIDNYLGTVTIFGSTLSDNSATYGGGVDNYSGTINVTSSSILDNTAMYGGGFYNYTSTLSVANSTLSGNSVLYYGGGIYNEASTLNVTNSTVVDNEGTDYSNGAGGGIFNSNSLSNVTINNTIVAENRAGYFAEDLYSYDTSLSGANNLIGKGNYQSGLTNGVNGNQVGTSSSPIDPMLNDLTQFANGLWGYTLLSGSPALDGGDNDLAVAPDGQALFTDIEGNDRIIHNTVDIGSVEMSNQPYLVTSLANVIATDGVLTFIEAFQAANTNLPVGDAKAGSSTETDVIQFAAGLSGTVLVTSGELLIEDDLMIEGPGAEDLIFDAQGQNRVFNIEWEESVTLSGMTITGGAADDGAGIYFSRGDLTLADCVISDNTATDDGGGIFNYSGIATIENCVITDNSAADGAGIFNLGYTYDALMTITNSTIKNNTASGHGGGINNTSLGQTTELLIINTTVSGNTANIAGGFYNLSSYGPATTTATNSTILENTAYNNAGGFYSYSPSLGITLNNTIVAGNTCSSSSFSADVSVNHSTLFGSHNLIGRGSSQSDFVNGVNGNQVGTTSSPIDPMFGSLTQFANGQWGYTSLSGSPVIDAGDNTLALDANNQPLTVDIADNDRIFENGTVDIGAVESMINEVPAQTYIVTSLENTIANDGILTFIEAFQAANTNVAVGDAQAGSADYQDTIQFATGLSGTVLLSQGEFLISDNLTIEGPGTEQLTFDGNQQSRVFHVEPGLSVALSGMTITNGHYGNGSGILNDNSTLTISDVTLSHHWSNGIYSSTTHASGGAIYNSGTLTVENSTISDNSATGSYGEGAGIYNDGTVTIIDSTITENTASGYGGGIYSHNGGTLTVTGSLFSNNSGASGGGIYGFNNGDTATLVITSSSFYGNAATGNGGGIRSFSYSGTTNLSVINSTFSQNSVGNVGGGISVYGTDFDLICCTLSENTADDGGGVHADGFPGEVTFHNSIIADNQATTQPDYHFVSGIFSSSYSLIGVGPSSLNGASGNQVGSLESPLDPMLNDLSQFGNGLWGYEPLPTSPVINAGLNYYAKDHTGQDLTEDMAGNVRIFSGTVDIGAYEFVPTPKIPGDANGDGKVDGSDVTILANNWQAGVNGGQTVTWSMGDFNGDGKVDGSDVTILANNWQAGVYQTVVAVSEPEPEPEPLVRRFTPPANALFGVATVPTRSSLSPRRSITPSSPITPNPQSTDAVLTESSWSKSDLAAIAKDLTVAQSPIKKATAIHDTVFATEIDPYADPK